MRKCELEYRKFIPNEFWNKENKKNLKNLKINICFGIIISILFTSFFFYAYAKAPGKSQTNSKQINANTSVDLNSSKKNLNINNDDIQNADSFNPILENSTNDYIANNAYQLGGAMSGVVSMSVSPITTLTILSSVGALQNDDADKYFYLKDVVHMARSLPVDFSKLPLANLNSVVVLLIILLVLFIIRTLHYTKIFTMTTIDRIENWSGQIIAILIIFITTSTTTAYAASTVAAQTDEISLRMYLLTTIISIIASVASGIIYYFVKTVCACLDILVFLSSTLLPPPTSIAVSGAFESAKSAAAFGLTILAVQNPIVSIIVSTIISALCIYFFKKSYTVVTYFKFIYIKPFWNALFNRNKLFPLVWNRLPQKISDNFSNIVIAIPAFPMIKIGGIGKKEKCWYIFDGETSYICKNYLFKKPTCISFADLLEKDYDVYLQKKLRFLRLFSDEKLIDDHKRLLLIISREYNNQFEELLNIAGLENYNELLEIRKEEKRVANEEKKKQKIEERMNKILDKQEKKLELIEKKQEFLLEAEKRKQLMKTKEKEFKANMRRIKKEGIIPETTNKIDEQVNISNAINNSNIDYKDNEDMVVYEEIATTVEVVAGDFQSSIIRKNADNTEIKIEASNSNFVKVDIEVVEERIQDKKSIDLKSGLINFKEKAQGKIIDLSEKVTDKVYINDEIITKISENAEKVKNNINVNKIKENSQKVVGGLNKLASKLKKNK